jgi:hypothetical protein
MSDESDYGKRIIVGRVDARETASFLSATALE